MGRIIDPPSEPGLMHICPTCGKWFAMSYVDRVEDDRCVVKRYRCKACGTIQEYLVELKHDAM